MLDVMTSEKDDPTGLADYNTNIILLSSELLRTQVFRITVAKVGKYENLKGTVSYGCETGQW